jgi:hypothetical protein
MKWRMGEKEKGRKEMKWRMRKGEGEKENLVIFVEIVKFDCLVAKIFYYENT